MSNLNRISQAWRACVVGDVSGCLEHLHDLPEPAALDEAERRRLDRTVDDLSAVLPARLASASGMTCEPACLSLLRELSDRGLFPGVPEYEALGVALMQGLTPPLLPGELPGALVAFARGRDSGDRDMAPIFAEVFAPDSLACFVTAFLPARRPNSPGNMLARLLCTTARALSGSYGDADTGVWLQNGLRLTALEHFSSEDARGAPDGQAMTYLLYHREFLRFHLAQLYGDIRSRTEAIDALAQVARSAAQAGLRDEAWFLSARVAALTLQLAPDAPERPAQRQFEAFAALEHCEHPGVVPLADLIHVAVPLTDDHRAATQRCWNVIRETLASLGSPMPAASRWRACCAALAAMGDLPLLSLFDQARWADPEQWALTMLPLFCAHPFPWRLADRSQATSRHRIKAVAMSSSNCTWDVGMREPRMSVGRKGDILTALWRQPKYRGIRWIGPDNIMMNAAFDLADFAEAGLLPVVRAVNEASRQNTGPFATAKMTDVITLASNKLGQVYSALRENDNLVIAEEELACAIGPLLQIPWEYHRSPDLTTAFVCLDPRSTGLAAVDVPRITVTPDTRLAVFADEESPGRAGREVEAIRSALGPDRVESLGSFDKDAFQSAALRCDILHVSAHGTQTRQDTLRNTIHFPRGKLSAVEIAEMDLSGVTLAFLNCCEAAAPGPWGLAGDPTIAGAMIAAGASAVIAALWPVEESCAEVLSASLYEELSSGQSLLVSFQRARKRLRRHAAGLVNGNADFLADAYRLTLRGSALSKEQAGL